MEGFLTTFPPFNVYGNPACAPPPPGTSWGKREGRFMTPNGLNYLELCKVILSQVNPGLPPPLKRANTRECGVQVNAKVDKVVQCSLGPKTLFGLENELPVSAKSPESPDLSVSSGRSQYETPPPQVSHLRFLRPVSIYSPVFDRRLFLKKLDDDDGGSEDEAEAAEQTESDKDAAAEHSGEDTVKDLNTTSRQSSKGSHFQVYYKQLCRKCQVGFNPYRVEPIICKGCSQTSCSCEKKQRHINMKRPHRQDLCCRCKCMRLSCDATYSFKYIV
ncbi:hypothetical protein JOB18_008679 [Solea senegalensis]|uniref:3CxxC-type domain-containing protein n=1 Tax=Solea senegalensis TaxID=28829 RepID=A0AAV6SFL7_SOLSE|nr:hypothetical protein JOB18_008679 [Solea senegalensis]